MYLMEISRIEVTNVVLIFCQLLLVKSAPVSKLFENGSTKIALTTIPSASAFKFMKQFGYLESGPSDSEALYHGEAVIEAIKNVQRFGGLPQTGLIDNATIALMESPRCGVPDLTRKERNEQRRSKRFILGPSGWHKRNITYFVANWSPKLGEQAVVELIQRALDIWGGYGRLNFKPIRDPSADIIVAFGTGSHGDYFPFDGPRGILAHAFYPYEMDRFGGDIHFDDDENWTTDFRDGRELVDFFTVAVHELGHSLGLAHSPVPTSVMYPYYKYTKFTHLDYDDILAMYELYIKRPLDGDYISQQQSTESPRRTTTVPTTTTTTKPTTRRTTTPTSTTTRSPSYPSTTTHRTIIYTGDDESVDEHRNHERRTSTTPQPIPDICHGNFDAVAMFREELFVFKNEYLWRMKKRGIVEPGYPAQFRYMFTELPAHIKKIDAAYQRYDGQIILFTGKFYWVFNGNQFVEGSPRPITDYGISRDVDSVDAVQVWNKNKKTYLYKGEIFWRFDDRKKSLDPGYPMHIKRWRGVPSNLDAALTWTDGSTYFFKNRLYWRFDNTKISVVEETPLPAPQVWLGCPESAIWWSDLN